MRSTGYAVPFISRCWAVIGAFRASGSGEKLFPQWSVVVPFFPVVFLDRGHPRFGNLNSAIPIDVIRVKSYVNSFLDHSGVPVRVLINKLYLVPKRVMAGLEGVLRNCGGLGTGESHIPVVFLDSLLHRSSCFPDLDISAFTRNPVDHALQVFSFAKFVILDTLAIFASVCFHVA